jgi:hypothetical protein
LRIGVAPAAIYMQPDPLCIVSTIVISLTIKVSFAYVYRESSSHIFQSQGLFITLRIRV